MPHDANDPALTSLIDLESPVRRLATGFGWVEGPVWDPLSADLVFSDIPGDVRLRWNGSEVVDDFRPTGFGNGMTYDRELDLLVCVHASSSIVRYRRDGSYDELASRFEGRELNSPNDVVVRSDGSIYFTDPTYGRMAAFGVERDLDMGFQGVYRIRPDGGDLQLVVDRDAFTEPNGLCFSPDQRLLYVNDTEQASIVAYDVRPDGALEGARIFASGIRSDDDPGLPDGMKCDEQGNVWVTAPYGIRVYAPDGRHLGTLRSPERVANFHWGGPDWTTLFLTASSSLYSVETRTRPSPEPFMRGHRGSAT